MALLQISRKYKPYYQRNTTGRKVRLIVKFLLGWFFLYQFITISLVASYSVDSVSMEPTLGAGDRILVSQLQYGPFIPFFEKRLPGIGKPQRGDIVVLRPPYYRGSTFRERLLDPVVRFFTLNRKSTGLRNREVWEQPLIVKRIMGVPGDTIRMKNEVVYIRPEGSGQFMTEYELCGTVYDASTGKLLQDWKIPLPVSGTVADFQLGADEYYVLGDNRLESSDSRYWGPIRPSDIRGKVIFRYFPLGNFGAP